MEPEAISTKTTSCCALKKAEKQAQEGVSRFSPFVREEDGVRMLALNVSGMHCARCIWAIESALQKEAGVTEARVNLSTGRLQLQWSGAAGQADDFVAIVEGLGYGVRPCDAPEAETGNEAQRLLRYVAVSGFAMGNIMLLSVALWSSSQQVMGVATRDLMHWISALIALPTMIYAGQPFFQSAWAVLRHGRTNMDVPISLALLLASLMSLFETIRGGEHAYFDSAVMLLFFLLIGRWLDARARGKVQENAENLLVMLRGVATVIEDGVKRSVAISDLREGMMVRIAAGEKIPTDVEVVEGESELDTSLVTGETQPRKVAAGAVAYGGTMNLSAPLLCRVKKASEDSLLADIVRLMEQAEQGRALYVRLADRAAQLYTPVVHLLALGAFLGWFFIGGMDWQDALLIAVTTLIITCPCALGLAVPVVQVLATGWLMKRGMLVKSGDALERLSKVDVVLFDKTGTLTMGKATLQGEYDEEDLQLAASLAAHSRHPYSQAIAAAFDGTFLSLKNVQEVAGLGVSGTYQGKNVTLGKPDEGMDIAVEAGATAVVLAVDGQRKQVFVLKDGLRPDAQKVVAALAAKCEVKMLSGDREAAVRHVAEELNIEMWQSGLKPNEKTEKITALQAQGRHVLMVGDGLNDAPALAAASVSMSPASGVDITQNSADIVFQSESLFPVVQAWRMGKFSTKLVKQNFALAVLYNVIAIPVALAGWVTPLVAAVAMSSSSLIVIANSFRINLKKG